MQKGQQVNLKKLNWRRMGLHQPSIARSGGAIWKELPKVEVPKEAFTTLFSQKVVVKDEQAAVSVVSM